jgi:hypothetical protein
MGVVCHAAVRKLFDNDPRRLGAMSCRFISPVYPGAAITSEFWGGEGEWLFRAKVGDVPVAVGQLNG